MAQACRTPHLIVQCALQWALGLEPSTVIVNAALTFAGPKNCSSSKKTRHVRVHWNRGKRMLWPPLVYFLKQVPADSKEIFFGWSWLSPVQSSLCLEKPLPVKHFLLYHLNLFLLLWLSQGLLCCFSQHTLSSPSLCTITCHGTFLPLLSSRSMLYYVNFFHLSFNLPGSLIFAIAPFQGTWGLMCLLMVPLWATVKFVIFFKSRNNFNDQIFYQSTWLQSSCPRSEQPRQGEIAQAEQAASWQMVPIFKVASLQLHPSSPICVPSHALAECSTQPSWGLINHLLSCCISLDVRSCFSTSDLPGFKNYVDDLLMPLLSSHIHLFHALLYHPSFLMDVVRTYRVPLFLIHCKTCAALERKRKCAWFCGCCFAEAPEIVAPSVNTAKILRSPEVQQNICSICSPQMCPDDPSSMFTRCQKLFIVRQFNIYWQFKEDFFLLQLLSMTGDLKMPF